MRKLIRMSVDLPKEMFQEVRRRQESEGFATFAEFARHIFRTYLEKRKGAR
jgi:metal-responsive CopG/Arc/MetJ family transcriptional regulator